MNKTVSVKQEVTVPNSPYCVVYGDRSSTCELFHGEHLECRIGMHLYIPEEDEKGILRSQQCLDLLSDEY